MDETEFPALICELYSVVARLEKMFPGRHFTPDGHLVGSIGEAIASHYYGVKLAPASTEGYDGVCDGIRVEIKATQGDAVALSCCPEHLLAFKLLPDGSFEVHYNGPGALVWALLEKRKPTKNGQRQVSLFAMRNIQKNLDPERSLRPVRPLPVSRQS